MENLIGIFAKVDGLGLVIIASIFTVWAVARFDIKNPLLRPAILRQNILSLCTSLGIFGTFVGIVITLASADFTPNGITESIPKIIGGMATAFITSVAGVLASIAYKIFPYIPKDTTTAGEDVDATDIHSALVQINTTLNDVKSAIAGDEDSALNSQIKLLRSDNKDNFTGLQKSFESTITDLQKSSEDNFEKLQTAFEEFSEKITDMATKSIVKALEEVIKEFNTNLTEQFGDNFKQLNLAVKELVTWQDNYKNHVETLTADYTKMRDNLTDSATEIEKIAQNTQNITPEVQKIREILDIVNTTTDELTQGLVAFADIKEKATEAFPTIEKNLELLTTELTKNVNNATENVKNVTSTFIETGENFDKSLTSVTRIIEDKTETLLENANRIASETQASLDRTMEQSSQNITKLLDESFKKFDSDMENEINSTVNKMGNNLVKITDAFVNTYNGGVDKMKRTQEG